MIDGIRPRKRATHHVRPVDRHLVSEMVVGRRSKPDERHPAEAVKAAPLFPTAEEAAKEPMFQPPEAVQAREEQGATTNTTSVLHRKDAEKKPSLWTRLRPHSKKQWIVFATVAILLLGGGGVGAFYLFKDGPSKAAPAVAKKKAPVVPPKPVTVASNLTGLQVDPAVNERPVTGIMIENSPDARPQSGLEHAGVVFEAIAEGGITRFLALFQDAEPGYIGPVRSVRPYYIQWAMGFDAPLAHVGGSPDGLALMRSSGAKDLDQFAGGAYFWRIASRDAPHNVYTGIDKLRQYENQKGYGKSSYVSFPRKPEKAVKTPTASSIDFNVSSSFYNPHYDYDPVANNYKRSIGGVPHIVTDPNGAQTQLNPKVVVALVIPQGANGKYTTYQTVGSGHAIVFQDGFLYDATWKKDANNAQFTFTDPAGGQLKFNAGQTWFTVVGDNSRVTFK